MLLYVIQCYILCGMLFNIISYYVATEFQGLARWDSVRREEKMCRCKIRMTWLAEGDLQKKECVDLCVDHIWSCCKCRRKWCVKEKCLTLGVVFFIKTNEWKEEMLIGTYLYSNLVLCVCVSSKLRKIKLGLKPPRNLSYFHVQVNITQNENAYCIAKHIQLNILVYVK